MQKISILPAPVMPDWMEKSRRPFHKDMYAFYSSEIGGIVTEPLLMTVPMDDHLVHRGDGVFETLKCLDGRIYCFREHIERLFFSSGAIGLISPWSREALSQMIVATVRAAGRRDCLIRILLSRGPGSMGISPYDCPKPNLYILVHRATPPFMTSHPEGARVVTSDIPVKPGFFATIKTCNYLPNAMLKKEAVDRKADFAVGFDENGYLAEGATENIGIVTREGNLIIPLPNRILSGTTMNRVFDLAAAGIREGWLKGKSAGNISRDDLAAAAEILIFGTTTDVTAVTSMDGRPVSSGKPGPVQARLSKLLLAEQAGDNPYSVNAFA